MKTLYFDCFSGISGDMTLGALIDCGINVDDFKKELDKLNIGGYSIKFSKAEKNGIQGTDVNVIIHEHHACEEDKYHTHEHGHHGGEVHHTHEHSGNESEMHHSHEHSRHERLKHNDQEHHHRNLGDIENIIDKSSLNARVKDMAKLIFWKLAVAEAKIHGKPIEDVHFHEVGAIDSIVDIVGTAICIDMLGVEAFGSSPVNTGMGFVKCQHGIIPIPGPAALELLKGVPIYSTDINTELVTPTGAAIISALCTSYGPIPRMITENVGYGTGKKDLEIPNLLRVIIGDVILKSSDVYMIECNIDDMNSEFYEFTMKRLFDAGALDVFLTNIIMKKGRPAVKLSVIAKPKDVEKLSDIIFSETTTIGVRKYVLERDVLERKIMKVTTKHGEIGIKAAYRNGKLVNCAPEYEEVKEIAQKNRIPVKEVYNEAVRESLGLFNSASELQ